MKLRTKIIVTALIFIIVNYIYELYFNQTSIYPSKYNNTQVNHRLDGCKDYLVKSKKKNMVVLFFTSQGCVPCKKMKQLVWPHQSIQVSVSDYYKSPKMLNSSNETHIGDFYRYKIEAVPTTIIIDKEGEEIKRYVGYMDVKQLLDFLN